MEVDASKEDECLSSAMMPGKIMFRPCSLAVCNALRTTMKEFCAVSRKGSTMYSCRERVEYMCGHMAHVP